MTAVPFVEPIAVAEWPTGPLDPALVWPNTATPLVAVDLGAGSRGLPSSMDPGLPVVVVGLGDPDDTGNPLVSICDVIVAPDPPSLGSLVSTVERNPLSSLALVTLLRGTGDRSIDQGLLAESAVYSSLQGGPEFARWRHGRPVRERPAEDHAIHVDRVGGSLFVTLDRPHVRNALNSMMRDELIASLQLPLHDPTITHVVVKGNGDSFCAGGDLDEFGNLPDPASGHLLRLRQSVGQAVHAVSGLTTVHLHGACVGSGIEIPSFAGDVIADPTTRISLPELSLGLIPGAGGTVSIPRRIGRWRTAWLALSGESIDATTAAQWGLVDEVSDESS